MDRAPASATGSEPGRWGDLRTRVISAVIMLAVAGLVIWLGGAAFTLAVAALSGAMVWELSRMLRRGVAHWTQPVLGAVAALSLLAALAYAGLTHLPVFGSVLGEPVELGLSTALPLSGLLVAPVLGLLILPAERLIFAAYALAIMVSGAVLVLLRTELGVMPLIWLVAIVVATDIAGYFGGRILGGPKFWPRVSPKKTWSGIMAGWILAALVALALVGIDQLPIFVTFLSAILLSFASQMGDIAESAIKRRMGVKDASALIPGHGGLLDRFDGIIGAATVLGLFLLLLGWQLDVAIIN